MHSIHIEFIRIKYVLDNTSKLYSKYINEFWKIVLYYLMKFLEFLDTLGFYVAWYINWNFLDYNRSRIQNFLIISWWLWFATFGPSIFASIFIVVLHVKDTSTILLFRSDYWKPISSLLIKFSTIVTSLRILHVSSIIQRSLRHW